MEGEIVKQSTYNTNTGELYSTIENSYGENEKMSLHSFYRDGSIWKTERYDYINVDEKWLMSSISYWDCDLGKSRNEYVYEYDMFGNAISGIVYDEDGIPTMRLELENNLVIAGYLCLDEEVLQTKYKYNEYGMQIESQLYMSGKLCYTYKYEYYE